MYTITESLSADGVEAELKGKLNAVTEAMSQVQLLKEPKVRLSGYWHLQTP